MATRSKTTSKQSNPKSKADTGIYDFPDSDHITISSCADKYVSITVIRDFDDEEDEKQIPIWPNPLLIPAICKALTKVADKLTAEMNGCQL